MGDNIKMDNITIIMDMLDWEMSPEIQEEGRILATNLKCVKPFIQPVTPQHNKNVWENCALVLAEKNDEELKPYLVPLLEWLQDLNWPGAFLVCDRVQKYLDNDSLKKAVDICIERAQKDNDEVWECNLRMIERDSWLHCD